MPAIAERLAAGTKLGPYELRAFLGAGGMGAVYRAHDPRLGRDVAIKVLPETMRADPAWQARFEREARAAAAINHPNVMALYDVGVHDGVPYLVCELLEGETLRTRLEHGSLPLSRALAWAEQIARGLRAAHERGLVHRDLKPANLLVLRDGTVKILDFGLAKAAPVVGTETTLPDSDDETSLTGTGAVVGTPAYMAPEQVRGEVADHRADLFAFGVVFYEMLAGHRPFAAASGAEMARAIVADETPALPPGMPDGLQRIVQHCLQKEPSERFQSARDIVFALEMLDAVKAPAPVSRRRRGVLWAMGIVAVLAAAGAVWMRFGRGAATDDAERASFEPTSFGQKYIGTARFLGDGHSIAFDAWIGDRPAGVFVGRLGKPESTPVVPGGLLVAVSRSDELLILRSVQHVAFPVLEGTLARVPAFTGSAPRDLAEHVTAADWSPDGKGFALVRNEGGRQVLEVQGTKLYETSRGLGEIRFAPDGQRIAFIDHVEPEDDRGRVAVVDLDGTVRRLTSEYGTLRRLAWSVDGREIYFSGGNVSVRGVHAVTLDGVVLGGSDSLDVTDVTRDGRLLVLREFIRVYYHAHVAGIAEVRELTLSPMDFISEVSPDGRLVSLDSEYWNPSGEYEAAVKPIDGGPPTLLGDGQQPKFAPDGKSVVVASMVDTSRLRILPLGPGPARSLPAGRITERWGQEYAGPDRVVFVGIEPGARSRIYVQDVAGGDPRPVSPEGFVMFQRVSSNVSPDGRTIVARDPAGRFVLLSTENREPTPIPGLGPDDRPIQWTDDGKAVYVYTPCGAGRCVDRVDVTTGHRERWREIETRGVGGHPWKWNGIPVMSRDGKTWISRFVVSQAELFVVTPKGR